jgi:tetratricopeptide (TPR) repeat protein
MTVPRRLAGCALAALLMAGCMVSEPALQKPARKLFTDLAYRPAAERYRELMERRYEAQDNSYVLSVLSYAAASFYARDIENARKAFTAAYRVDDGDVSEAAKVLQWLVADSRTVYRLSKRERELVHFYLALCYLYDDDPEGALVEFKKLRLRDQEASELPLVNFYAGLTYERLGMYDDAVIEYRGLREMGFAGRHRPIDADELIARAERLARGEAAAGAENIELVVHVDHQFPSSMGRTVVRADGAEVGVLPDFVDDFEVRLTSEEQARKEAQEVGAAAAREGIRLLAALLGDRFLKGSGDELAGFVTDVLLGKEEVELEFHSRRGGELGSCRYPLAGEDRRVLGAGETRFIVAGLADEFYDYR